MGKLQPFLHKLLERLEMEIFLLNIKRKFWWECWPVDQRGGLHCVESVLSEGLDDVPNVDVMEESLPLHVSNLCRRPVRRKPAYLSTVEVLNRQINIWLASSLVA